MTATLARVNAYEATRLVLPDGLDFEEWREQGMALQQMAVSIQWWVGDWYLAGENQFGESAAAAVAEACGWAEHTVQNAAWVAKAIPPTSRRRLEGDAPLMNAIQEAERETATQGALW